MFRTVLVAVGAMGAAALLSTPQAAAEPDLTDRGWAYAGQYGPAICQFVDANPTVDGFVSALKNVGREGFSAYEASGIVIAALSSQCPHNYWLVDAFVDSTPAPPPAQILA
ncbi:hypothetical protein ABGB19_20715 [Mycobacterium sp. B14F4]|uniref:hypothetical protein n=1 Tax=Mycobacterium sp. B14F4 TaxID=3153565 RepID=UPI00325C8956